MVGPVWLINTPTFISPLAITHPDRPETTQRAQVVIAGSELCNLFSELNDPVDQLDRFVERRYRLLPEHMGGAREKSGQGGDRDRDGKPGKLKGRPWLKKG